MYESSSGDLPSSFFRDNFFMPPGLMTSFNVSVGPIYSFFLPTELIAFANRPKISQNTSDFLFPETRIRL